MTARPPSAAIAALVYGAAATATVAAPVLAGRLRRRLPGQIADSAAQAAVGGLGFAGVFALERMRPHRAEWNRPSRVAIPEFAAWAVLGAGAMAVGDLVTAPARARIGQSPLAPAMARMSPPARLAATIVGADLVHTMIHRTVHRVAPLWRLHRVHHDVDDLCGFRTGTFHPVESAMVVAADQLVVALLGLDPQTALRYRTLRTLIGQVQHSNVAMDSGWVGAVLATPERHRWHHSALPEEHDTNFGSIVCIWDRALGTDTPRSDRTEPRAIGLATVERGSWLRRRPGPGRVADRLDQVPA
jgi:sterol desaturase/sphingolipid hydroxylase (fatty acid hydroxylase superfamily)